MVKILEIDEQKVFYSGHQACPGCSEALALRHILNTLGHNTAAVVPPSCIAIISGPQPYSSMSIPVYQTTLESSAASASGIKQAFNARGKTDTTVIAIAGDGGTYDIGFQSLSSAVERNEDIIYFCLDNEGYMNTGAQKSSATPQYALTSSTPAGKSSRKKNITEIMAAHQIPYAATATIGFLEDLVYKVKKASGIRGTKIITILTPCPDGWGFPENSTVKISRLAVETGIFPLYEVENGEVYRLNYGKKNVPVEEYLNTQKRYRHLTLEEITQIQEDVDHQWNNLKKKF